MIPVPAEHRHLLDQLTSTSPENRADAARALKTVTTPLMGSIIQILSVRYCDFTRMLNNVKISAVLSENDRYEWMLERDLNQLAGRESTSRRHDDLLGTTMQLRRLDDCKARWIAALEGARLYLYVTSDSLQTGLLELSRLVVEVPSEECLTQGRFVVRYCGTGLTEPLLEIVKSQFPEIRAGSLRLVGVLNDARAYEQIRSALQDDSVLVRNVAAEVVDDFKVPVREVSRVEIIREIVKIPCEYCDTLIENTCTFCPCCGAPQKR